jgi:epoxyqueuosine reductase
MEKPLAAQAGLGWAGKHTNIVSRQFGSWLFLGEIYTTLPLPADAPASNHCGSCTRCLDICPTDAFIGAGRIDARKCISYLTIENKGHIPPELRPLMGNRIYGCDDCMAACPWDRFAPPHTQDDFYPRPELHAPHLADLLTLDDASFRHIFTASPIKRIGRDRFIRNVCIAAGNSQHPALIQWLKPLVTDHSPLVQVASVWALHQLCTPSQFQHHLSAIFRPNLAKTKHEAAYGEYQRCLHAQQA